MAHPFEWVSNQVKPYAYLVCRLSAVEVRDRADLPVIENAFCETGGRPRRIGNVIGEVNREEVPGIEVSVSVVEPYIREIIRNGSTILANFIKSMRPGICELRRESVPVSGTKNRLQRVVIRRADCVQL